MYLTSFFHCFKTYPHVLNILTQLKRRYNSLLSITITEHVGSSEYNTTNYLVYVYSDSEANFYCVNVPHATIPTPSASL